MLIETLGMIPNYYLHYFYHTDHKLAEQANGRLRARKRCMAGREGPAAAVRRPGLTEPPADLMKRGGAYYSTVATQLLNAHYNDLGETHVVNVARTVRYRVGRRTGCWRCPAG